jgi:hypothetical protein
VVSHVMFVMACWFWFSQFLLEFAFSSEDESRLR